MKKILISILLLACLMVVGCDNKKSGNQMNAIVEEPTETISSETIESTSEEETTSQMDETSFISLLENEIRPALGGRDKIISISFSGKELVIEVSLEQNFKTLDRFSSITDHLLSIKEGYNLWDSVKVDFGSQGYIVKTKNNITSDGAHFSVTEADLIK